MAVSLAATMLLAAPVSAINPLPTPSPSPGSYGLEATKRQPAPTTKATISTPVSGGSYTDSPITVSGLCTNDLIVQVYDNGVLVGAINCQNGSFSLQVSLFTGDNEISVTQFDDLGQASPDSNHITLSYNNADFQAFGTLITLTSNYGRRAANPGDTLAWPLQLSGGTGPYALSIDWGDGKPPQLVSQPLAGEFNITHVYSQSGIYHVSIKVTDVNGVSAFLQVVAVANGKPTAGSTVSNASGGTTTLTQTKILWVPLIVGFVLLIPTYWLGRRSELFILHRQLEKSQENYKEL